PRRGAARGKGPQGMGGAEGAVKQRGPQRRHRPRPPRLDHARPSRVVNGPREVPDPLRETAVGAEGLPPLKAGRRHRFDPDAARLGEPARPAVDVAGAVQYGQRFAGHSAVIDKAIGQLEAGGRAPLARLLQGRGGFAHIVLFSAGYGRVGLRAPVAPATKARMILPRAWCFTLDDKARPEAVTSPTPPSERRGPAPAPAGLPRLAENGLQQGTSIAGVIAPVAGSRPPVSDESGRVLSACRRPRGGRSGRPAGRWR